MPIINGIPLVNETVQYAGHTIPPKEPLADVPVDPNVNYAGKTLPAEKVQPVQPTFDPTNHPRLTIIGTVTLPQSTNVLLSGDKILAESQIIDGVSVFEHINRKPYEIEFKFIIWDSTFQPAFPQSQINNIWTDVWVPNTVQKVQNTYLNGIGVQEIIIKSVKPMPKLGSKNVDMIIKAVENQPGQTIIM